MAPLNGSAEPGVARVGCRAGRGVRGSEVRGKSRVGPPISPTAARDRLHCAAAANTVSPAPVGRPRTRLIALIAARPDATLVELCEALPTSAALSTLWRAIDRLQLTVEKAVLAAEQTPA